ncbi:flagellar biosynthesis anti-sigma factor FlgM [Paenacidovorax monticola]|uniref:Negative regulator of flagellin synthesis n=1 Tax=Paenacidovorax monticola TaxID=1926868 RepID=A0A7H0HEG5_9BURK|nr:flagellar biosynthesis anti-sigma factor FlgM [Paenacidovorax monticola]MBO9676958.1 flagellar biosynthesis anti-sigma factor FlgM [Acidovorax sp.]QNP58931.1 flagellar biosynthesis anti-sigma factor FlgM [Paenacidovorax monticola]
MKIGQNPDIANALSQAGSAKQQAKTPAPAAEAVAKSATAAAAGVPVTFSNTARGLDAASRNQGDFDAGKVKAVRNAIDNGTFTIDAEAIADKLLANAQEVMSRSRG